MEPTIPHFAQLAAGDGEETFWIQLLVMVILATGIGIYGVIKKHKAEYNSKGRLIIQKIKILARHGSNLCKSLMSRSRDIGRLLTALAIKLRQALMRTLHRTTDIIRNSRPSFQRFLSKTSAKQKKSGISLLKPVTQTSPQKVVRSLTEAIKPGSPVKRSERNFDGGMELLTTDFLVEVVENTGSTEKRDITMRTLCFVELARRGQLWGISSDALKAYTLNREEAFDKSIRYRSMKELSRRTAGGAIVSLDTNHRKQPAVDEVRAG